MIMFRRTCLNLRSYISTFVSIYVYIFVATCIYIYIYTFNLPNIYSSLYILNQSTYFSIHLPFYLSIYLSTSALAKYICTYLSVVPTVYLYLYWYALPSKNLMDLLIEFTSGWIMKRRWGAGWPVRQPPAAGSAAQRFFKGYYCFRNQ